MKPKRDIQGLHSPIDNSKHLNVTLRSIAGLVLTIIAPTGWQHYIHNILQTKRDY